MIQKFIEGYKDEVENGVTHPLGRLALSLGIIMMIWGAVLDNPDGGPSLNVFAAVITILLIIGWFHFTMEKI